MSYGYRAMFILLSNYYKKYALKTIRGWISRYAPSSENQTDKYIEIVSKKSGIHPDQEIDITNRWMFVKIISAMSYVENGIEANIADVETGYIKAFNK
jgi:hypothetical protein